MEAVSAEGLDDLPVFPLATVLFPGALLPLHIFEERYKKMMRYAIENGGKFGLSYREDAVKPTFVVDISAQFERKLAAIKCYASQFDATTSAGEIFPTGQDLYSRVETQSAHYGSLIRTRYGEPYFTHETVLVDDVVKLGVQSM